MPLEPTPAGWSAGESIALELDLALSLAVDDWLLPTLPADLTAFAEAIPQAWRAQWADMFGPRGRSSLLAVAADLAGVLHEGDYDRATLAMRELSPAQARARVAQQAAERGLAPDLALPPDAQLGELVARLNAALYHDLSLPLAPNDEISRQAAQTGQHLARVLRGGDLHGRFWHWLDRFFFEFYRPWRATRAPLLEIQRQRAAEALGAPQGAAPPPTAWLPPQNPLLRYPELRGAVQQGRLAVHFLIEPFGMADLWSLHPGELIISFAVPGALYEQFQALAADVALRVQALADPTRLTILRLIRHFGAFNTEIAEYLELSRPTVSVHAKILREAGLIRSRQEGRQVRHEIVPAELHRLFRDLERFLALPEE